MKRRKFISSIGIGAAAVVVPAVVVAGVKAVDPEIIDLGVRFVESPILPGWAHVVVLNGVHHTIPYNTRVCVPNKILEVLEHSIPNRNRLFYDFKVLQRYKTHCDVILYPGKLESANG